MCSACISTKKKVAKNIKITHHLDFRVTWERFVSKVFFFFNLTTKI